VKKYSLLSILSLFPLAGQTFVATHSDSPSGAAAVYTVQAPGTAASVTKNYRFVGVTFASTVATTFTIEINGGKATATSFTCVSPDSSATSNATCYYNSDSSAGTVIGNYQIPAGGTVTIDLSKVYLTTVANSNLTVRTNSITGTVSVVIMWTESVK
jgi:hypothetical protein